VLAGYFSARLSLQSLRNRFRASSRCSGSHRHNFARVAPFFPAVSQPECLLSFLESLTVETTAFAVIQSSANIS
jgi:hypothetical protein